MANTPAEVNDKCIMEAVLERIQSPTDLRIFNNWRKYFKVNYLSELCNAEGTQIFYKHMQYPNKEITVHQQSKWTWPIQGRPGVKRFQTWRRIIEATFQCTASGQIPIKLSAWHSDHAH
jgi:hypothetical protein